MFGQRFEKRSKLSEKPIVIGSQTMKALMLCRWQTSSYRDACLQLPVNYFVRVRKKKQSVSRVEVTSLFAVAETELVLM